jgi:2-methylisocitrate lyase-like PEP mutase family enzyme
MNAAAGTVGPGTIGVMADLLRSPGAPRATFRRLLAAGTPIVAPGAYDVLSARLIEAAGFDVVYVTGFGSAASLLGRPDVGLLGLGEMADQVRRVVGGVDVPVVADADTGYGNAINVIRTVQEYERAGVAALHLEDQVLPKRCGHMENKAVVTAAEMVGKIRAAVDARRDPDLVLIARTDARAVEGVDAAIARAGAYRDAGADMLFVEALRDVDEITTVAKELAGVPLVFNWAEGGKTPPLPLGQIADLGFALIICPITTLLSATAAITAALATLRRDGTPVHLVGEMPAFGDFLATIGLPEVDELSGRYAG